MQKTVLHNQSALDCSLQHTGGLKNIIEFADANGISITDDLKAGDSFEPPEIEDTEIHNYFKQKNIIPATAITDVKINENETLGIGAMVIESTFIVG